MKTADRWVGVWKFVRWHPFVGLVGLSGFIALWVLLDSASNRDPDPSIESATVMSFQSPGVERATEDTALAASLTGAARPSPELVTVAACHNLLAWHADLSLGPDLLISTDPAFARVGEMLDTGVVAAATAATYEQHRLDPNTAFADGEAFERYLKDRAVRPSSEASSRFVAFVTNETTTRWKLVLIDATRFAPTDADFLSRPAERDVLITGGQRVAVRTSNCDALETE